MSIDDMNAVGERLTTLWIGRSIDIRQSTTSTNDDARAAAEAGAPSGHTVIADAQTSGRGAHGHTWSSPSGTDAYLSVVVRPSLALRDLPWITLATGLAVSDAVNGALSADRARIKWPNDVLVDGKKIAGILVESASSSQRIEHVVVGIGLNINRLRWNEPMSLPPTSLAICSGRTHDRAEVVAALLSQLERWLRTLDNEGAPRVRDALRTRLAWRDNVVQVDTERGVLRDIAEDGSLILDTPQGIVHARAGTLRACDPTETSPG